jgi:predicted phosphoribosyltransferase
MCQRKEAMLLAASNSERDAAAKLNEAKANYEALYFLKIKKEAREAEASKEREEIRIMRRAAEKQMQIIEKDRRNIVFTEKELANARAKIRRLEEKQRRWLGKID